MEGFVFDHTMRPILLALAILLSLGIFEKADAQVAIYRFSFEKDGPAVNYGFYDEAWVVADAIGGPTSWVFTFKEGAVNHYVTVSEFGSLFYANNQKVSYGIISAAASTGTPQTTFLAIGELEDTVRSSDGNVSVKVADDMEGSTLSADDQSDLPFDSGDGNAGYAAISTMTGGLEARRTADANTANFTIEEAVADIVTYLEQRGFAELVIEDETDEDTTDTTGEDTDNEG